MPRSRVPHEARRSLSGLLAGLFAGALGSFALPWQLSSLLGWDVGALVLLLRILSEVWSLDGKGTREAALREDDSRHATIALLVLASTVSLVGVLAAFVKSRQTSGVESASLTIGALVTVALSWLLVHTLYALRYAHLYYRAIPGGISFSQSGEQPDYHDFAYVALTVGMTFQTSDTPVTDPLIRRTVLRHALLAYLFGAVILATTINVVAGLVR